MITGDLSLDVLRAHDAALTDLSERAGPPHRTPHQLRHRRISVRHFEGVPAREVAEHAGHSKPSMSLGVYSHVIVPEEVDPEELAALLATEGGALTVFSVMHG